jgi:hypothetical protein
MFPTPHPIKVITTAPENLGDSRADEIAKNRENSGKVTAVPLKNKIWIWEN